MKKMLRNESANDAKTILISAGYKGLELRVDRWYEMNFSGTEASVSWRQKPFSISWVLGDELVVQFPIIHHTFFSCTFDKAVAKPEQSIFLIHDWQFVGTAIIPALDSMKIRTFTETSLAGMDGLIVHNDRMKEFW